MTSSQDPSLTSSHGPESRDQVTEEDGYDDVPLGCWDSFKSKFDTCTRGCALKSQPCCGPFVKFLKCATIIPRTWFPAVYAGHRSVTCGFPDRRAYPTNHVCNSKYTLFTFPFHNLAEQFLMSHSNRYFLLVALVQLWRAVSPVSPVTTWIPLIIVFSLTAMFALIDDIRRKIGDKKVNGRKVTVIRNGVETRVSSFQICVGDYVVVSNDEEIPCDMVILHSTGKDGAAYMTTANLDGEVDLKTRSVSSEIYDVVMDLNRTGDIEQTRVNLERKRELEERKIVEPDDDDSEIVIVTDTVTVEEEEEEEGEIKKSLTKKVISDPSLSLSFLSHFEATITCTQPDPDIYSFPASISISGIGSGSEMISLSSSHLLLQSCKLKNTERALGVCIYNGIETKCGMNKSQVPSKRAKSDYFMDRLALLVFGFQMFIFVVFGVLGTIYKENDRNRGVFYIRYPPRHDPAWVIPWYDPIIMPVRFWLLTTYMIPISLKVTLDFMKLFYSLLIMYDRDMCDPSTFETATARNSAIVEDLGQVQYILTDKTGTLTQNVMQFQRCSIVDTSWGDMATPAMRNEELRERVVSEEGPERQFFRTLAICHTCEREVDKVSGKVEYMSVSPDEIALVRAAKEVGVDLVEANDGLLRLLIGRGGGGGGGDDEIASEFNSENWKVLRILKFNSDRKRMSVLAQSQNSHSKKKEIVLFSKGADDTMLPLIRDEDADLAHSTLNRHLSNFAKLGLRTLVIAFRVLSAGEYVDWEHRMKVAETVVGEERSAAVDRVQNELEQNLTLLGTTAIEDKLQDYVPETIYMLREAGIAIWMLTGDKFETAKQIGYSCNLVTKGYPLVEILGQSRDEISASISRSKDVLRNSKEYSLIIEGGTLRLAFRFFPKDFKTLCLGAKTVVCARVNPKQKAEIVRLVKREKKLTLAIGDGGNDVPMIQEAHVGVGLTGKEGLQASRAADFSFSKFRFLIPLILVHGHYALIRSGLIIQFSFYKNILLAFLQVMFNVFTHFSGSSPYNDVSLSQYNSIFTIFVPVVLFDRMIDKQYLKRRPKLYFFSKGRWTFSCISFAFWFLAGIFHALVLLFVVTITYSDNVTPQMTGTPGQQYLGVVIFTAISWVIDFVFLLFSNSYSCVNIFFVAAILAIYQIFILVYNTILPVSSMSVFSLLRGLVEDDSAVYFVVFEQLRDPNMYMSILLGAATCCLVLVVYKYLKVRLLPNIVENFKSKMEMYESSRAGALGGTGSGSRMELLDQEEVLRKIGGGYPLESREMEAEENVESRM